MRTPALLFAFTCSLSAQARPPCVGPAELQHRISIAATAEAYNALGAWFGSHENTRCAISSFEAALKADPGSRNARYNLGLVLARSGQLQGASRELRTLVKQDPGSADAHRALGGVLQSLNDLQGAESEFRTSLNLNAKSAET
jgi:Tfp pilus assembly protein PilF